jgi:hypothetical protein
MSIKNAAQKGFFNNLLEQVALKGAVPVSLKAGGKVTETQLHAWAVSNGMVYLNGMLAVDQRARRPLGR